MLATALVLFSSICLVFADYVPSFYNSENNDDVYAARFRYIPCSICFRNQIITNPDFILPINSAGVLQTSAASCAEADALAAAGTFSPAACILLRSRVKDVCGCQYPPPTLKPTPSPVPPPPPPAPTPVTTTVEFEFGGIPGGTSPLDPVNRDIFERVCAALLAERVGDVSDFTCEISFANRLRRLLEQEPPLVVQVVITGITTANTTADEFDALVTAALNENQEDLVDELREESPDYFGNVESIVATPVQLEEEPLNQGAPTKRRKIGPFSVGGFSGLIVGIAFILVLLIAFTYLAGNRIRHDKKKQDPERIEVVSERADDDDDEDADEEEPDVVVLPALSSNESDSSQPNLLLSPVPRKSFQDERLRTRPPPEGGPDSSDDGGDNGDSILARVLDTFSDTSVEMEDKASQLEDNDINPDNEKSITMTPYSPNPPNDRPSVGISSSSTLEITGPFLPPENEVDDSAEMLGFSMHAEEDSSSEDEGTMQSTDLEFPASSRSVIAPPGKLGIVIDTTPSGPIVHRVNPKSPLFGKLFVRDVILAVDNVDTRDMSASAITALMVRTSGARRTMTVDSPKDDKEQA